VAMIHPLDKYLRLDRIPHLWCSGCGNGIILSALLRAIDELANEGVLDPRKVVLIAGIGCAGRIAFYINFDTAHVLHGRAIPFAMGVKLANPSAKVIVYGGDGDLAGIGGNHLIHAARRNLDITVLMVNNFVYALTGGQVAPTTPKGVYTTTTPRGNPENPVNVAQLVTACRPNYVARASVTHPILLKNHIKKALMKEGFSFIEIISLCPEVFGRHIGFKSAPELYERLRKIIKVRNFPKSLDEIVFDWEREITIGEFIDENKPGFIRSILGVSRET